MIKYIYIHMESLIYIYIWIIHRFIYIWIILTIYQPLNIKYNNWIYMYMFYVDAKYTSRMCDFWHVCWISFGTSQGLFSLLFQLLLSYLRAVPVPQDICCFVPFKRCLDWKYMKNTWRICWIDWKYGIKRCSLCAFSVNQQNFSFSSLQTLA